MPKPSENETKEEFISRCIAYVKKEKDWENDRVAAYCYSIWRDDKKSSIKEYLDNWGKVSKSDS